MLGSHTQFPSMTGAVQVAPQAAGARLMLMQSSAKEADAISIKAPVVAATDRILLIIFFSIYMRFDETLFSRPADGRSP
jgi:hypothetical protein